MNKNIPMNILIFIPMSIIMVQRFIYMNMPMCTLMNMHTENLRTEMRNMIFKTRILLNITVHITMITLSMRVNRMIMSINEVRVYKKSPKVNSGSLSNGYR